MATVRGMTPEAILALIRREVANVKLSERQIRDLIDQNKDIVDSVVDLNHKIDNVEVDVDLGDLHVQLENLRSELVKAAEKLDASEIKFQESAEKLIENNQAMAQLTLDLEGVSQDLLEAKTELSSHRESVSEKTKNYDELLDAHLKAGVIVSEHIRFRDGFITNAMIGNAVIRDANIQNLDANKLTSGTISADRIRSRSISAYKLMTGTITSENIKTGTITGENIKAGSIRSSEIGANAITANKLDVGSVTAEKIASQTITGDKIAARTITGDRLQTHSITTNELAAGSVSADKIAASGISADLITAGMISATRVLLSGNDLESQISHILASLDRQFETVRSNADLVRSTLYGAMTLPMFFEEYGQLEIPQNNDAIKALHRFLNSGEKMSLELRGIFSVNKPLDLRSSLITVSDIPGEDVACYVVFPITFSGRIIVEGVNGHVEAIIVDPRKRSEPYSIPILFGSRRDVRRIWWFKELFTVPYTVRYVTSFNNLGRIYRTPPSGMNYITPVKINASWPPQSSIEGLIHPNVFYAKTTFPRVDYGTGGTHVLSTVTNNDVYNNTDITWYYPTQEFILHHSFTHLRIKFNALISQPKRSSYYGYAVYFAPPNSAAVLVGHVSGTDVGTVSGFSLGHTYEPIQDEKTFKHDFVERGRISLIPFRVNFGSEPSLPEYIMRSSLELQFDEVRPVNVIVQ